ncbi:dimethylarginine dimethylaminohydrolase family protein [Natranaerobius trueperi]|uniref:Amidinotransferase n=1 Tax=Natranaerobius trueperi TaxID=759412 RepID=A0A226C173_9FIRM|nr:arginine deiminase family protein [Natranaerobius trueperi]OWZ84762.1 amidinotransferase [Natranaerobius trueperi]
MKYNGVSEVNKLRTVLVKHAKDAYVSQKYLEKYWKQYNFLTCPDYERAIEEYEKFLKLLQLNVDDVYFLPEDESGIDSIYVHDPAVITPKGAILGNMGKENRKKEPDSMGEYLKELRIPIIGQITGNGKLEGGDVVWLDEETVAIGIGYRTNKEGIRQFKQLTKDTVKEVIEVDLPHLNGPQECIHLMSLISPIDNDLAVVYSKFMAVSFREYLLERGYKLVEVSDYEFHTQACNVLAIAPRKCIMLSGNPETRDKLEKEGVEVLTYIGDEISHKGMGGPTCLTRPIFRTTD